jgi:hypothetical protein
LLKLFDYKGFYAVFAVLVPTMGKMAEKYTARPGLIQCEIV